MINKKKTFIAVLAASLVLATSVGGTMSYFTTYAEAKGQKEISLGYESEIHEDIEGVTKHVTLTTNENSQPVYARVRAYTGSKYNLIFSGGEGWYDGGDGYWYYEPILYGGETTASALNIELDVKSIDPDDDIENINVIVMYEITPVIYEKNGETFEPTCDWDAAYIVNGQEGGAE